MALGIGYALPFIAGKQGGGGAGGAYGLLWQGAINDNTPASVEDGDAGQGSCLFTRGKTLYDVITTTPSLLIVPQIYKSGLLSVDIPSPEDFTVTRATTATRVNSSGLIESVASGVPRLDYLASGGVTGCPGLLVEPAATNLVPSGLIFNTLTGVQTSSVTVSPAAAVSGTLVTKNEGSGSTRFAQQTCSTSVLAGSTTYVISRFFKYYNADFTTTLEFNSSTNWGGVSWSQSIVLSAASGVTLGTSTSCTGSLENYGNGWYRVSVKITTGASPTGSPVNYLMRLPSAVIEGQGFYTALPQLETGTVATTYIPTTSASVTRNADFVVASGAVASGLIGQDQGTIYVEFNMQALSVEGYAMRLVAESFDNSVHIRRASNNTLALELKAAGTTVFSVTTSVTGYVKAAIGYQNGSTAAYVNGVQIDSTSSSSFSFSEQFTSVNLGSFASGSQVLTDRIRAAALYTTRLSDGDLQKITT